MVIWLVKLTSIVMVVLLIFLSVALRLGFVTNHFELFRDVLTLTSGFLLLVGVWYFLVPPHRSISKNRADNAEERKKATGK